MCTTLLIVAISSIATAQTFETASDHPGDIKFVGLPYPIAFVAADRTPLTSGPPPSGVVGPYYSIGTDIVNVVPTAGHQLYYTTPGGSRVVKLFPLSVHSQTPGLIDTPAGSLERGAVTEPAISEDGKRIYFGYFPDPGDGNGNPSGTQVYMGSGLYYPKKGADLYYIDISAAIANPSGFNPNGLPVVRLTTKTFTAGGSQVTSERIEDAMNPGLAVSTGSYDVATINMHPVEMRGTDGQIKLVFVSNRRQVKNSNGTQGQHNYFNFNLFIADIDIGQGKISNEHQFQYYTTTNAVSPVPMKDGIAFSYQGNINEVRQWHQQALKSSGQWSPLLGYGRAASSFHLGTYCIKNKGAAQGDYFISDGYYNANNHGFGAFYRLPLDSAGLNELVQTSWGKEPNQVGVLKISNFTDESNRDEWALKDSQGNYYGKGTTPMCGKPDELLMAWTFTNANDKNKSATEPQSQYDALIAYRPNLEPFNPLEQVSIPNEKGLRFVVDETSGEYNLVFPVPVLNWQERTGQPQQRFSEPNIDVNNTVKAYEPYAVVGTSDLGNSDGTTLDCRANAPYTPNYNGIGLNINTGNWVEHTIENIDALTWVPTSTTGSTNYCTPLKTADVFGIEISLTSNKSYWGTVGYDVDGGPHEAAKLLGIYDRTSHDGSFKTKIPAQAPFQFHLLHVKYGLRLTDLKSWHSLYPGESRTDCGGCHGHDIDITPDPVPFDGTFAATHDPADLVTKTPYIEYDPLCKPVMKTDNKPTRDIPVWGDIYPQFNQYCGNCHNSATATDPQKAQAQLALTYNSEDSAYNQLKSRKYMDSHLGALGSLAFMAARNERTDGRNNNLAQFQPDYAGGQYGFRHSNHPDLCNGSNPTAAKWVYQLGLFLDHDSPKNIAGNPKDYHFDWYHPTVHGALTDEEGCSPSSLTIGFWDDTGSVAKQDVYKVVNGTKSSLPGFPRNGTFANGSLAVSLAGLSSNDSIGVDVFDAAGNRQKYERSIDNLVDTCLFRAGLPVNPDSSPSPTPSPTPPGQEDGYANLSVNKTVIKAGRNLILTVDSNLDNVDFIVGASNLGTVPGTPIIIPGTTIGTHLSLNDGKILKRSLNALNGNTDSHPQIKIKIPASIKSGSYHFQAMLKTAKSDGSAILSSPPIEVTIVSKNGASTSNKANIFKKITKMKAKCKTEKAKLALAEGAAALQIQQPNCIGLKVFKAKIK